MAIRRTLPTNPQGSIQPILSTDKATYSLPKKKNITPEQIITPEQPSSISKDLIKTLLVSILILGIILFAVSRLN